MEAETQGNNNPCPESADPLVLNISGEVEPKRSPPRVRGKKKAAPAPAPPFPKPVIPEPPKVSPTTFPVITSRILLKSDVPPAAVPKINLSDFDQNLCFLCMEKPDCRKLVFHMYLSNEKELERDSERMRKMYEHRKDLKIVERVVLPTVCARSLCHRVRNKLTGVTWNKQKIIFETDKIGERDVWKISHRIDQLVYEELEKLFNYIKFLSATNS